MKPAAEDNTLSPPNIRSGKSSTSIISGHSARERVDSHGNPIQKGSKNHRCSFRDEQDASQAIHDVKEVTAYKTPYFGGEYRDDDKQGCACTLM
mmetsp:Transcript_87514/g.271971  ORF Transcript_87514/g.271971 Transcript_87514/m.271971 type:complete len:94 (+) Transcript_87514:180-461(+)